MLKRTSGVYAERKEDYYDYQLRKAKKLLNENEELQVKFARIESEVIRFRRSYEASMREQTQHKIACRELIREKYLANRRFETFPAEISSLRIRLDKLLKSAAEIKMLAEKIKKYRAKQN